MSRFSKKFKHFHKLCAHIL